MWNSPRCLVCPTDGVATGRVGRGSVEGTGRDLANRNCGDNGSERETYQGQSSKLGVGSQREVLYCTVLHHMAPGTHHNVGKKRESYQKHLKCLCSGILLSVFSLRP